MTFHVSSGGQLWQIAPHVNGTFLVSDFQRHSDTRVTPEGTGYIVRCVNPLHRRWWKLATFNVPDMFCSRCACEHAQSVTRQTSAA